MPSRKKTKKQPLHESSNRKKRVAELKKWETTRTRRKGPLGSGEEMAKAFLEAFPGIAALVDTQARFLIVNRAMAERLSRRVDDLIGTCGWDLLPEDMAESRKRYFARVIHSGESVRFEDGRNGIWFDNVLYPLFDDNGKVTKVALIANEITERKQAEEALRDKEEYYRVLIENSSDGIAVLDAEGLLTYVSPSYRRILGNESKEQGVSRFTDNVHPDDVPMLVDRFARLLKNPGGAERVEVRARHEKGNWVFIEALGRNLLSNPVVAGIVANFHEITERKRAEEDLRQSESRLQAILENTEALVFIKDLKGRYVLTNRAFEQAFNIAKEDFVGKTDYDFMPKEMADQFRENDQKVLQLKKPLEFEETALQEDGIHTAVSIKIPMYDHEVNIYGVCCIATDITERKWAEEALREERDFSRNLLQASPTFFVAINGEGRTMMMNETMLETLGYAEDEVIGTNYLEAFVPEPDRDLLVKVFDKLVDSNEPTLNQNNVLTKDGRKLLVEWHGMPVLKKDGKLDFFFGVGVDITERSRMEEEIARTRNLESLGILAGGIAHDFNNLLTPIMANISIAKTYENLDPEIADMLTDVEKASLRAKGLTQQLLTFAKGGAPIKKTIYLSNLLKDTTQFALSGSNVRCEYSLPDDLWPVEVDEGQISQVIHNMVVNADQAMVEGGILKILAQNLTLAEKEHLKLKGGRYAKISIEDQGHGIGQEHLPKIFDPFFTIKEKGRGLGLTTSLSVVTRHRGHIDVDSTVEVGTNFHIYLPASEAKPAEEEEAKETMFRGKGRILLIDDEEFVRKSGGEILARLGYDVTPAKDGEEGIGLYKKAMEGKMSFDTVIMDLTIPGGMGGKQAIERLLEIDSRAKVIVSSGYSDDRVLSNFQDYGFSGVLAKPYRSDELAEVVQRVLKGVKG